MPDQPRQPRSRQSPAARPPRPRHGLGRLARRTAAPAAALMVAAGARPGRRRRRTAAALLAGAVLAALLASIPIAGDASATTGDTYVLPPSRYVIPPEVMSRYFGSYHVTKVAKATRLDSADIFITANSYADLYGGGTFYGYDSTGAQTSWTNVLYDFHLVTPSGALVTPSPWTTPAQVAADTLVVTLYGWGSPALGTLTLHRHPDGDLSGTIRLRGQSRQYPITFHRIGPAK